MSRQFIDRFQFYRDSYLKARVTGDEQRQHLWEIYEVAQPNFRDNTELAMAHLQDGVALARRLKEPCWELLFEFWLYEANVASEQTLDRIIKLFVKANAPVYRECTLLGDIYASLLRAYLWHDPLGYEEEVLEGIRYILENIPIPQDTYCSLLWTKMQQLIEVRQYEAVLRTAKSYFRYAESNEGHQAWGYVGLMQAYYHLDELILSLEAARDCEDAALRAENHSLGYAALKWQWMLLQQLQDHQGILEVRQIIDSYDLKHVIGYDVLHEAQYEFDLHTFGWIGKLALVRDAGSRIQTAIRTNRPYLECKMRLRRIAGLMALPRLVRFIVRLLFRVPAIEKQLEETRSSAQKLIKPHRMLATIDEVEAGDYTNVV